MLIKRLVTGIVLMLFAAGPVLAMDTYVIDKAHSSVGFSVKHLVISKVKGTLDDVSATVTYDEKDITKSSVNVVIQSSSIDTDNERRDNHLRSADFLDIETYPEITFKSKKIEKANEGYVAIGDFTMHGVTKEIALPFTITGTIIDPSGNTKMGVESLITVKRSDYGLTWNQPLEAGGVLVSDEVDIELYLELGKQQ
ncbi:MAG: YceI family protein [candidate division Zixibacteria bacterium]|nr:YceI family protein [candidate division Zixibacteria bacterium]MBU1471183.1 YceI family protein [candidate division Zixibacteria bacterium]MBU2625764.1 YceI family protein [candidate division Zixibacteria bacterium]